MFWPLMRNKASTQHENATRSSPYATSPTTNSARKKMIQKTPVKNETIPSVVIGLFKIRLFVLLRSISVQIVDQPLHHLISSSFKAGVDHAHYLG